MEQATALATAIWDQEVKLFHLEVEVAADGLAEAAAAGLAVEAADLEVERPVMVTTIMALALLAEVVDSKDRLSIWPIKVTYFISNEVENHFGIPNVT